MLFGSLNFKIKHKNSVEEWSVALFMLYNMEDVFCEFQNPLYSKIVQLSYYRLLESKPYTLQEFLQHEDEEIRSLAVEFSNPLYEYNKNWSQKIKQTSSTQPMREINLFKLRTVERMYKKNQIRLKDASMNDFENMMQLLKKQQQLMDIRKELAGLTGTNVLN